MLRVQGMSLVYFEFLELNSHRHTIEKDRNVMSKNRICVIAWPSSQEASAEVAAEWSAHARQPKG